jgi:hypothetical protein
VSAEIVGLQAACAPVGSLGHIGKLQVVIFMTFNALMWLWLLRHLLLGLTRCLQESRG